MFRTVSGVTASAIATGGTLTITYPTGTSRGTFAYGTRHRLSVLGKVFSAPEDMTIAFGASSAVITYNGTTTIPAGRAFTAQFDSPGEVNDVLKAATAYPIYTPGALAIWNLGSPTALAATSVCAAQAVAGAVALTINGTKATSSVYSAQCPTGRALKVVSAGAGDTTQTLAITGTDMYGQTMRETIALNGTTIVSGKKAFATVTSVVASAATAGNISVGDTDILGLPSYLPVATYILKELTDNAAPTAGTTVAGLVLTTKPTATTADVRGTYLPNQATDGSKNYVLVMALPDPTFLGATQY